MTQADFGLIGLGVMGQNLVLNIADHNDTVAVYNRTASVVDDFLAGPAAGARFTRLIQADGLPVRRRPRFAGWDDWGPWSGVKARV